MVANKKFKILLVEDDLILAEMYQDKFKQADLESVLAIEAETGLSLAKSEKPDLVVLDILLPKQDGIFFLQEWRKDPEISAIPVIAFSNYNNPDTQAKAVELGAKCYLLKTDYTPDQLIKEIKNYLNKKS